MHLKNMIEAAAGFFAVRKCAVCGKVLSDEERGALCSRCEEKYRALKDEVCSPGGTTIEAVKVLEEKGLRAAVIDSIEACVNKSRNM